MAYLCGPPDAVPQHPNAHGAVVLRCALIQAVKVDGMLQGTVFDQAPLGYVLVIPGQAHDEAKIGLWVGIQLMSA